MHTTALTTLNNPGIYRAWKLFGGWQCPHSLLFTKLTWNPTLQEDQGKQFHQALDSLKFSPTPWGLIQMRGLKFSHFWGGQQGFLYWGNGRSPSPTGQKVELPTKCVFPPQQTKQQFSCYNPIKTSFLAVVIAPAPFSFKLDAICTQRSC